MYKCSRMFFWCMKSRDRRGCVSDLKWGVLDWLSGEFVISGKRRKRGRFIDVIFENFEMFYGLLECSL